MQHSYEMFFYDVVLIFALTGLVCLLHFIDVTHLKPNVVDEPGSSLGQCLDSIWDLAEELTFPNPLGFFLRDLPGRSKTL